MDSIYLDTNIFVSLLSKDDKYQDVKTALQTLSNITGLRFVTSIFTFVETAKSLIHTHKKSPKWVAENMYRIQDEKKIDTFNFFILPVSTNSSYSFDNFWIDVGQNMNLYNPGWGDSFHCVIMKNNDIKQILSTDGKHDFKIVPGIKLLQPKDVK